MNMIWMKIFNIQKCLRLKVNSIRAMWLRMIVQESGRLKSVGRIGLLEGPQYMKIGEGENYDKSSRENLLEQLFLERR